MKLSKKTKIKRQTHELFFVQPACCGSEWISSTCAFIWSRPISFSCLLQSLLVGDLVLRILQGWGLIEALPSCHLQTQDNLHTARKHRGDLIASHPVPASCLFDFSTLAGVCHVISTQLQEKLAVWLPQPQKKVRSETWQCSNGAWEK